jgi:tRNA modification GTPase
MAGREVAIVAATPGTTRDVLEVRLDLGGVPVTLLDTAGLRDSADAVEAEGVRRARARVEQADLVVLVSDASDPAQPVPHAVTTAPVLRVCNKIDLAPAVPDGILAVSALVGSGMNRLHDALAEAARDLTGIDGPPSLTRPRHRAALRHAMEFLERAATASLAELRGEDLRMALRSVGTVTGRTAVEDVLDSVFRQFCIGK